LNFDCILEGGESKKNQNKIGRKKIEREIERMKYSVE